MQPSPFISCTKLTLLVNVMSFGLKVEDLINLRQIFAFGSNSFDDKCITNKLVSIRYDFTPGLEFETD